MGTVPAVKSGVRQRRWLVKLGALTVIGLALCWYESVPRVSDAAPARALPSPNAYDAFQAAASGLTGSREIGEAFYGRAGSPNLPPTCLEEQRHLVSKNAAVLRGIRAALGLPYVLPPSLRRDPKPQVVPPWRDIGRLFALEARVRTADGDNDEALGSCLDAVQFGAMVPRGGTALDRDLGLLAQQAGRTEAWPLLDRVSGATAAAGVRRMEAIDAARIPLAETCAEDERIGRYAFAQLLQDPRPFVRILTENGIINRDYDDELLKVRVQFALAGRRRLFNAYADYLSASTACADLPYQACSVSTPRVIEQILPFSLLAQTDTRIMDAKGRTQDALLTTALALRAFQAERGRYPARLEELTSEGYLAHSRVDPFSREGTSPLHYRRVGVRYTLYSVGPDGYDDGGRAIAKQPVPGKQASPESEREQHRVEAESKGDIVAGVNVY